MHRRFAVWATALAMSCAASCSRPESASKTEPKKMATAQVCDTSVTPPPDSNFPKGFDYPQQAAAWVEARDGGRTRLHGWCLFAGLNQSATPGQFVWQTWKTSTQAFPYQYNPWISKTGGALKERPAPLNARNLANAKVDGENAINFPPPVYAVNKAVANNPKYAQCLQPIGSGLYQLKDGQRMQSNGDIMIAGVVYNDAALQNILKTNLFDATVLNAKLPAQPGSPASAIPDFPAASMVLKPMFWPVQKGGFTVLPVWDWDAHKPGGPDDGQYAGYEMQKMWTRAVVITDQADAVAPSQASFLYGVLDSTGKNPLGPNTYTSASLQVVPVTRFYNHQYTQVELDQLSPCDRALLDASAWWAYNRAFQAGDYVVLVAMHIMTKEQPDWTFQTVWWHPDANSANCGRYCGNRPTNLADTTFQNYMLAATYGMTQKQGNQNYYAPPGTKGPVWPVAYNPYIELAAAHPITTNCMNCHHRAAWPPQAQMNKPDEGRSSTYLQESPANPNALETFPAKDAVFNGLVKLDAMWAVSDRAGYPAKGTKK